MAWVKLDDGFLDHRKFLNAGPLASYLNVCAIAWSNRNLTDGFIPDVQVPRLINWEGVQHVPSDDGYEDDHSDEMTGVDPHRLAWSLVENNLWHRSGSGFQIHDYHVYQPLAEKVRAARADDKKRKEEERERLRQERQRREGPFEGSETRLDADEHKPVSVSERSPTGIPPDSKAPQPRTQDRDREDQDHSADAESVEPSRLDDAAFIHQVFDRWQERCDHPQAKLTADRRAKVKARIREGRTLEDFFAAIEGAARAAFVNDEGKRFDDLELICRSGAKFESFMARAVSQPPNPNRPSTKQERMARGVAALDRLKGAA
jgi:hypothetical protein